MEKKPVKVRIRVLRNIQGEKLEDPDRPEQGLEVLSKGSVVDVSYDFAMLMTGGHSPCAELVEDKTPLFTADLMHAPAPGVFGTL